MGKKSGRASECEQNEGSLTNFIEALVGQSRFVPPKVRNFWMDNPRSKFHIAFLQALLNPLSCCDKYYLRYIIDNESISDGLKSDIFRILRVDILPALLSYKGYGHYPETSGALVCEIIKYVNTICHIENWFSDDYCNVRSWLRGIERHGMSMFSFDLQMVDFVEKRMGLKTKEQTHTFRRAVISDHLECLRYKKDNGEPAVFSVRRLLNIDIFVDAVLDYYFLERELKSVDVAPKFADNPKKIFSLEKENDFWNFLHGFLVSEMDYCDLCAYNATGYFGEVYKYFC